MKSQYLDNKYVIATILMVGGLVALSLFIFNMNEPGKGKMLARKSGQISPDIVGFNASKPNPSPPLKPSGFSQQVRLGFFAGDQWEPAIAADRFKNVYILYPQYGGVPGCDTCASPTMILQTSRDRGNNWSIPRAIYLPGSQNGQWDPQITVDPIDGKTVYASWLQNGKSDTVVARSDDFGFTWTATVANSTNAGTDKPILAVRGSDVYVGYNHAQAVWVSASHDGGKTFTSAKVKSQGVLGWSLASGGTVTPDGKVHFAWAGYERNGNARGDVNLFISRSDDGGSTWTNRVVDISSAPPDCSAYFCGWAFLGAQIALASDSNGVLYILWNASDKDRGPARMYFSRSTDGGNTWTDKRDVSSALMGSSHAFPAITAGAPGDVRIAWMDTRQGKLWNTIYRSSQDGGRTWEPEIDISTFVDGFGYIFERGFSFPFGDYFELDIDDRGITHAIWGQGLNYDTPGSIWYSRGK